MQKIAQRHKVPIFRSCTRRVQLPIIAILLSGISYLGRCADVNALSTEAKALPKNEIFEPRQQQKLIANEIFETFVQEQQHTITIAG